MEQISSLEAICLYPELGKSSPFAHINITYTRTPSSAKWFLSFQFSTKTFPHFSTHTFNMPHPSHALLFCYPNNIWRGVRPSNFSKYNFLQSHLHRFTRTHIISSATFPERLLFPLNCQTNVRTHGKQRPLS